MTTRRLIDSGEDPWTLVFNTCCVLVVQCRDSARYILFHVIRYGFFIRLVLLNMSAKSNRVCVSAPKVDSAAHQCTLPVVEVVVVVIVTAVFAVVVVVISAVVVVIYHCRCCSPRSGLRRVFVVCFPHSCLRCLFVCLFVYLFVSLDVVCAYFRCRSHACCCH